MDNPFTPDNFGAFAGLGIFFVIGYLVFMTIFIIVAIWIQYTIMWKAVRRGMNEFHYGTKTGPGSAPQAVAPPRP